MNEFRNDLLKRTEVQFVVEHASNPGFSHVAALTAQHYKVDEDVVVIKELCGHFGSSMFAVRAFVYDSAADKARIEPKPKVKKGAGAQ